MATRVGGVGFTPTSVPATCWRSSPACRLGRCCVGCRRWCSCGCGWMVGTGRVVVCRYWGPGSGCLRGRCGARSVVGGFGWRFGSRRIGLWSCGIRSLTGRPRLCVGTRRSRMPRWFWSGGGFGVGGVWSGGGSCGGLRTLRSGGGRGLGSGELGGWGEPSTQARNPPRHHPARRTSLAAPEPAAGPTPPHLPPPHPSHRPRRLGWVSGSVGWGGDGWVGELVGWRSSGSFRWRGRVDLVWSLWAMAYEGHSGQARACPRRYQLRPSPTSTQNPRLGDEACVAWCGGGGCGWELGHSGGDGVVTRLLDYA